MSAAFGLKPFNNSLSKTVGRSGPAQIFGDAVVSGNGVAQSLAQTVGPGHHAQMVEHHGRR